jgi:hypothetical protein
MEIKLTMFTSEQYKQNMSSISKLIASPRNWSTKAKIRKTYGVGAGADAEPPLVLPLVLSSVWDMSPKRLSMSGKKSSLGKTSSSWASVMKNSSVVAQSAPQKPYRLSPV